MGYPLSTISSQRLHRRSRRPPSSTATVRRKGFAQWGQTTMTFESANRPSFSMIPPLFNLLGRVCRLMRLSFSTTTFERLGITWSTFPCLPRSFPLRIMTVSPFLTRDFAGLASTTITHPSHCHPLQHLGRERNDLHELLPPQLTRHRAEDPRADRLPLRVDQHGCVAIELDVRPIVASHFLRRPYDHRLHHLPLFDAALGDGLLHRHRDHVADRRVPLLRSAVDVKAHDLLSPLFFL